jgi:hypothetical protein
MPTLAEGRLSRENENCTVPNGMSTHLNFQCCASVLILRYFSYGSANGVRAGYRSRKQVTGQVPINGIIGMWPKSSRRKIPHSDNPTSQDLASPLKICGLVR